MRRIATCRTATPRDCVATRRDAVATTNYATRRDTTQRDAARNT
jgi:hypothetical protein